MKANDALYGALGLCMRAGGLTSGAQNCEVAIKRGQCKLLLLDEGASQLTRKRFMDWCAPKKIEIYLLPRDELGDRIGKPGHMAAVITQQDWANRLREKCREVAFDLLNNSGVE